MPAIDEPGREDLGHAQRLERGDVGVGDDAAAEHEHLVEAPAAQLLHHPREQRHVGAGEQRQPDGVGVLLHGRLGDLLGRLVQPGVDDLEAVVPQRPGDGLGPPVVPVEAGLGHDDSIGAIHGGAY